MRVTTWAEYGLLVSMHLARRANDGALPAREVAEAEQLPADYVEQILLRLRRAGIVSSVRGARGGYFLARPATDVTVKDVLSASEHGTFEVNCERHTVNAVRCAVDARCSLRPVWQLLKVRIDETLAGISLADLMGDEDEVRNSIGLAAVAAD